MARIRPAPASRCTSVRFLGGPSVAYRLLAEEGTVVSLVGRGTSVAPGLDRRALALEEEVDALVVRARQPGMRPDVVIDLVRARSAPHTDPDFSTQ